jgi:predicted nucleic acid-binding protein
MNTDSITHKNRFVIDTTAIISYFDSVFERGSQITKQALQFIDNAFEIEYETILVIPGVVFVEIFDKWFHDVQGEEFQSKFRSEVLEPILRAPNIEIREIDNETLEAFLTLQDQNINLENRDRLILASAVVLNTPLITSDSKLIRFVRKNRVIPYTIN